LLAPIETGSGILALDSMTVIRDFWGGDDPTEPGVETYSEAVAAALSISQNTSTHI
jgi:ribonuclease HI